MNADHLTVTAPVRTTRVVLGFDGSTPARAALEVAVRQARSLRVPLLLLCAVEVSDAMSTQAFSQVAEQMLADTAAAISHEPGITVTTGLRFGSATAALLEAARPGDLIVVGTHGHRPVARVLLGSTSTSLVTHAHEPVLVVRTSPVTPDAPVVVGVDGSTSSVAAVRSAKASMRGSVGGVTMDRFWQGRRQSGELRRRRSRTVRERRWPSRLPPATA